MVVQANRSPALRLEQRRSQVEQVRNVGGQVFEDLFYLSMSGTGEKKLELNFSVYFYARPFILGGTGEITGGSLEVGNFPTFSAGVYAWRTESRGGRTFWVGCTAVLVTTGSWDQSADLHIGFKGEALQNPLPS